MSNSNGKIDKPIRTGFDVATVLQVNRFDIGYLCSNKHKKINKWSRKKPVIDKKIDIDRSSDWWKGSAGNCGLVPISTTNYRNVANLFTDDFIKNGWTYQAPQGGELQPFRLADFYGYNHYAQKPFKNFSITTENAVGESCNISFITAYENDESYLHLSDISYLGEDLSDYFYGCVIFDNQKNYVRRLTTLNKSDANYTFNLPSIFDVGKTYIAYPILSKYFLDLDGLSDPANNIIFPIPETSPKIFTVVTKLQYHGLSIILSAQFTSDTSVKIGRFEIKSSKKNINVSSCSLHLRYNENSTGVSTYAPKKDYGSFTINQNTTKIFEAYTFTGLSATYKNQYVVYLTLNTGVGLFTEKFGILAQGIDPLN